MELSSENLQETLSLKNIKKAFYAVLHDNGFPETSLEIIKAQTQMEYLGMYSKNSQFRNVPKIYIHTENNIKAAEENRPLDNIKDKTLYAQQVILDTLTHEYMHSVYEFLKENCPTPFRSLYLFDDEEDFVETAALFITRGDYKEIMKGNQEPFCDEDKIICEAIETFKMHMFYPEDVQHCQNPQEKYKVIIKCIESLDTKYQIEDGTYLPKVHNAFNKHAAEHFDKCFSNEVKVVYIQNAISDKYPMISISTNNPEKPDEKIYIDNIEAKSQFTPNKAVYTEEEIAPFIAKNKRLKIK